MYKSEYLHTVRGNINVCYCSDIKNQKNVQSYSFQLSNLGIQNDSSWNSFPINCKACYWNTGEKEKVLES